MAWSQTLLRLQEVDHELERGARRLAEIAALLQDDAAVVAARREAEVCAAAAQAARRSQQELEFELNRVQTKRRQTEERLYSGRVTNPRELQDMQAESEALKHRIATLEDALLEAMLTREEADEGASAAQAVLQAAEERSAQQHSALSAELQALRESQTALKAEREALCASLSPKLLDTYTYLRGRTDGIPVAQVRGDVCSICGTELLPPTVRKVRNHEEAYCDSCRRLLVA